MSPDARVSVRGTMLDLVDSADVPVWVRVGCVAWAHANAQGHARMGLGQLARDLGVSVQQASNALVSARQRGWVGPTSTARCLVVPGHDARPCDERHR